MAKNNPELGREVNKFLDSKGINTPVTELVKDDREVKMAKVADLTKEMLEVLGLDLTDDSLEETPMRVAKMYVDEIFSGLRYDTFPKCTTVENKFCRGDEFVLEKNITLYLIVSTICVLSLVTHTLLTSLVRKYSDCLS